MKKSVHVLTYKGFRFETWWHKAPGKKKPVRAIYLMTECVSGVFTKKMGLKYWMDKLILDHKKDQARKARTEFLKSLSNEELVKHPNFAYARLKASMSGNYYSIYWKDSESPTGVDLVGSCPEWEWEAISRKHGVSHHYLSPTEKV